MPPAPISPTPLPDDDDDDDDGPSPGLSAIRRKLSIFAHMARTYFMNSRTSRDGRWSFKCLPPPLICPPMIPLLLVPRPLDDSGEGVGASMILSSRWYKLTAGNSSMSDGRRSKARYQIGSLSVEIESLPSSVSNRIYTTDWLPNPGPKSEVIFARPCHKARVPMIPQPHRSLPT